MDSLETELERARALEESELADAIETIGFEWTRCRACCYAESACVEGGESADEAVDAPDECADSAETDAEPHHCDGVSDEIRQLQAAGEYDFRDVARPMPYGLADGATAPRARRSSGRSRPTTAATAILR